MTTPSAPRCSRRTHVACYASPSELSLLRRAAKLDGRSLSSYILRGAVRDATAQLAQAAAKRKP